MTKTIITLDSGESYTLKEISEPQKIAKKYSEILSENKWIWFNISKSKSVILNTRHIKSFEIKD